MQIEFLQPARAELDDAVDYYNKERAGLGDEFLTEILSALQRIAEHPHAWHAYSRRTRRCQIKRFPYAIIYRTAGSGILIVAVAHMHREPGYWKNRSNL